MELVDRRIVLALVFTLLRCGGTTSDPAGVGGSTGTGGSADASRTGDASVGSGGSSGTGPASGGSGGVDCGSAGMPAFCSTGCQEPGGCCPCAPGDVLGIDYICQDGCWARHTDAGASCTVDTDCPIGSFCRPLEAGGSECVAFVGEGDNCIFQSIWAELRCAPGLRCVDGYIAAVPGTCRVPCASDSECPAERYCASSRDVCRDDGSCFDDLDCDAVGNNYSRPSCIGYGQCTSGTCSYTCGNEACRDLGDALFGACETVLGFAVVGGQCKQVNGCDSRGHMFFASENDCLTTCGA